LFLKIQFFSENRSVPRKFTLEIAEVREERRREFDTETNLYYYRARYYDPTPGRFASEDPIRFWAGNDFYRYVSNRPVYFGDPQGYCPPPDGKKPGIVHRICEVVDIAGGYVAAAGTAVWVTTTGASPSGAAATGLTGYVLTGEAAGSAEVITGALELTPVGWGLTLAGVATGVIGWGACKIFDQ
jgi:RHS repeat-associated protein